MGCVGRGVMLRFFSIFVSGLAVFVSILATAPAVAQDFCEAPQTPRDITLTDGANRTTFPTAPSANTMNLCNMHFHANAEHKGPGFLFAAGTGDTRGGFVCNNANSLTDAEREPTRHAVCGDHTYGTAGIKPGDTIEVHWVYTSCPVHTVPGKGLNLCSSATCTKPTLRVESQVFLVVNNPNALNLARFDLAAWRSNGHVQPKSLPHNTGTPVSFRGSTTGPTYANKCSDYRVTWNVRPKCARLDINSLANWCRSNKYAEHHGHGVRPLITSVYSLDRIGSD